MLLQISQLPSLAHSPWAKGTRSMARTSRWKSPWSPYRIQRSLQPITRISQNRLNTIATTDWRIRKAREKIWSNSTWTTSRIRYWEQWTQRTRLWRRHSVMRRWPRRSKRHTVIVKAWWWLPWVRNLCCQIIIMRTMSLFQNNTTMSSIMTFINQIRICEKMTLMK